MRAAAWKCCITSLYQPYIKDKFETGAGVVLGGHMRAAARKDGFRLESPLLQLHSTSPHPHSQMGRNQQRFFQKDTDY